MIIDGKAVAQSIQLEIKNFIEQLPSSQRRPGLAVIQVGSHRASEVYIRIKKKSCERIGIYFEHHKFSDQITQKYLIEEINKCNKDNTIDAILVQLPLPATMNEQEVMAQLDPDKDADGFHPLNIGKLLAGFSGGVWPCTPKGVLELLNRSQVDPCGKHVVIVGRSNIVGKPLAGLLIQKMQGANATVTVTHSKTQNLSSITQQADILIVCLGSPQFIGAKDIKDGCVVIDVGINKIKDNEGVEQIVGDVDTASVMSKVALITPVPGGVGPMTVAMLLQNTCMLYRRREKLC